MATIFGPSVADVRRAQEQRFLERVEIGRRDPAFFAGATAGNLFGKAAAEAFGIRDPEIVRAQALESAQAEALAAGHDPTTPEGLEAISELLLNRQLPQEAMQARALSLELSKAIQENEQGFIETRTKRLRERQLEAELRGAEDPIAALKERFSGAEDEREAFDRARLEMLDAGENPNSPDKALDLLRRTLANKEKLATRPVQRVDRFGDVSTGIPMQIFPAGKVVSGSQAAQEPREAPIGVTPPPTQGGAAEAPTEAAQEAPRFRITEAGMVFEPTIPDVSMEGLPKAEQAKIQAERKKIAAESRQAFRELVRAANAYAATIIKEGTAFAGTLDFPTGQGSKVSIGRKSAAARRLDAARGRIINGMRKLEAAGANFPPQEQAIVSAQFPEATALLGGLPGGSQFEGITVPELINIMRLGFQTLADKASEVANATRSTIVLPEMFGADRLDR